MKLLHSDDYCDIVLDTQNILWLNWNANSETLPMEMVQDITVQAVELGQPEGATRIVTDLREYRGPMDDSIASWYQETLIPKFIEAGIQKQGILIVGETEPINAKYGSFEQIPIQAFKEVKDLLGWLG